MKYYAVVVGRQPGVYTNWSEAEKQVKGFPGAIFKSFPNEEQATAFINNSRTTQVAPAQHRKQHPLSVRR